MITERVSDLLAAIIRRQIVLTVDPAKPYQIRYHPKDAMTTELAERILRHKYTLIEILFRNEIHDIIRTWPEDWIEEFDERAGILEFDANLPKQEAEKQAFWEIRRRKNI